MARRSSLFSHTALALVLGATTALFPQAVLAQPAQPAPDQPPAPPPAGQPAPQPAQPAPGPDAQPKPDQPAPKADVSPAAGDAAPKEGGAETEKKNPDNSALADDGHPLAGYHNGLFYLRDPHDNFRLHVQGRAQIDAYTYFGPGVSDTTLKPTLFLRRIRPEVTGEILHHFWFQIAGDFGATALDNPKGTNEISAAAPGAAPSATSGRYASAQTTKFQAAPTDVFIIAKAHDLFQAQIGQFDAPFTMENRTSDKFLPFMERSLAVRAVGIPTNKEIGVMAFGEHKLGYYALGIFNGDGQNKLNTDSKGELIGRAYVRPLATVLKEGPAKELKDLQIGGSFLYGSRDKQFTDYDYPSLSTQGNYTFWSSTYTGAGGPTHIIPSGDQVEGAFEIRVPISIIDVMSEFVYVANGTREAIEGFEATNSERFGKMVGWSYYIEAGVWAFGKRDIRGLPGVEGNPHVDFTKPDPIEPPVALEFLAKWEQLKLTYKSASRGGTVDAKNIDGDIKANAFTLGANFWATKHLRFTANYVLNWFPDSAPVKPSTATDMAIQGPNQRALAPAQTLAPGVNDNARDNGHLLHELLFRAAVAL